MEQEIIEIDGEKLIFFIQRKNIKNMNLRVNNDRTVVVSIPKKMKNEFAKDFVKRKIKWIKKQQSYYNFNMPKESTKFENDDVLYLLGKAYKLRLNSSKFNNVMVTNEYIELYIKEKYVHNKDYIKNFYEKWLKQYAFEIIEPIVIKYQKILKDYGIKMPIIEVKKRKAVWGSCHPQKGKVIFNVALIKTPIDCIEYVVLHELAHFKYQNHSKYFYSFVAMFMPNWKEKRLILNKKFAK